MKRLTTLFLSGGLAIAGVLALPTSAQALSITPTNASAAIIAALTAGNVGLNIDSMTINSNGTGATGSLGTFTNVSGTYGIGTGVVMASGEVADYGDGPNSVPNNTTSYGVAATASQDALLDSISGAGNYFDVTELLITFHMDAGFNNVFFNVVFGSEEFPEFVGSTFIDGFGLLINGVNVAIVAGQPVNVNHPSMSGLIGGTQLDGILAPGGNPVLNFGASLVNPTGANTLRFIVADRGDSILDSVAYIGSLGGNPTQSPVVPEPASLLLVGAGTVALGLARKLRNRRKA